MGKGLWLPRHPPTMWGQKHENIMHACAVACGRRLLSRNIPHNSVWNCSKLSFVESAYKNVCKQKHTHTHMPRHNYEYISLFLIIPCNNPSTMRSSVYVHLPLHGVDGIIINFQHQLLRLMDLIFLPQATRAPTLNQTPSHSVPEAKNIHTKLCVINTPFHSGEKVNNQRPSTHTIYFWIRGLITDLISRKRCQNGSYSAVMKAQQSST